MLEAFRRAKWVLKPGVVAEYCDWGSMFFGGQVGDGRKI